MKESTKGALLSFLVYPGLGQLVLGFKSSGVLFAVLSTTSLLVIIYRLTLRIYQAIDPILSSLANNTLSLSKIIEIINQSSYDSWRVESLSLIFLVACWITAGVHAYLVGRKMDRKTGGTIGI
jgi:hypothetical protein